MPCMEALSCILGIEGGSATPSEMRTCFCPSSSASVVLLLYNIEHGWTIPTCRLASEGVCCPCKQWSSYANLWPKYEKLYSHVEQCSPHTHEPGEQEAPPNRLEFQFQPTLDMYTSNSIYVHTSNNVTGTQLCMHNVISSTVHIVHKIVIGYMSASPVGPVANWNITKMIWTV